MSSRTGRGGRVGSQNLGTDEPQNDQPGEDAVDAEGAEGAAGDVAQQPANAGPLHGQGRYKAEQQPAQVVGRESVEAPDQVEQGGGAERTAGTGSPSETPGPSCGSRSRGGLPLSSTYRSAAGWPCAAAPAVA